MGLGLGADEVEVILPHSQKKENPFGPREYDKMDDVMGQAWVTDPEDVWRLATVRSVASHGSNISVVATDGKCIDNSDAYGFNGSSGIAKCLTSLTLVLDRAGYWIDETLVKVEKKDSHPFDPSHAIDMPDLANLNNMHEAPLLHVLKRSALIVLSFGQPTAAD